MPWPEIVSRLLNKVRGNSRDGQTSLARAGMQPTHVQCNKDMWIRVWG